MVHSLFHTMKKAIFFLCLVLLGCDDSKEETSAPVVNTYSLVFIDKTQSVNPNDPFVKAKYSAALQMLVEDNIKNAGDQIDLYYIHENTSKAKVLSIISRTEKEDQTKMSPTDKEASDNAYHLSIKKERQIITQALMQKFLETNTSSSNAETHVTGSVPVISEALKSKPSVQVYYFSDMVESKKGGRDFHIKPPASADEAVVWAREDMGDYEPIGGAKIHIILPFSPNSSSKINNPNVSAYWKRFFDELGANPIKEE